MKLSPKLLNAVLHADFALNITFWLSKSVNIIETLFNIKIVNICDWPRYREMENLAPVGRHPTSCLPLLGLYRSFVSFGRRSGFVTGASCLLIHCSSFSASAKTNGDICETYGWKRHLAPLNEVMSCIILD